eukprot:g25672.t1
MVQTGGARPQTLDDGARAPAWTVGSASLGTTTVILISLSLIRLSLGLSHTRLASATRWSRRYRTVTSEILLKIELDFNLSNDNHFEVDSNHFRARSSVTAAGH